MSLPIWRPQLPDSIDGRPLASSPHDIFGEFPYRRLPDNAWVGIFLRPGSMLALLAFYLVSKPIFKAASSMINPKAGWFVACVAIHNFGLAVFSGVVAANGWPIMFEHAQKYGWFETYCDPNDTLWSEAGLGAWTLIFYISKFYEFLDTWILVLKGKPPSFLQVYHHTGIAFCMWIGVLSHSSWLKYVTLFNSVIHTLMYTYFFIKTISPKTEIKAAKNLTMAQITQFFIGIVISFPILFMGDECNTASSRFGLLCLHIYGYGLVGLFMAFAKKKYKKN